MDKDKVISKQQSSVNKKHKVNGANEPCDKTSKCLKHTLFI